MNLLTKEIFVKKISAAELIEENYSNPKFMNEDEKYSYTNLIKFEIVNHTSTKFLFFIKDLKLNDIYNISIIIEDEHGNVLHKNEPLIDPILSNNLGSMISHDNYIKSENELLLKKLGYNVRSTIQRFYGQELIVYPTESFTVYTTLTLPYVVEDNEDNLRRPVFYKFDPLSNYSFRLKYKLKDNIEEILPKELLDNYKSNNIEIFKHELETQKIPIIFK